MNSKNKWPNLKYYTAQRLSLEMDADNHLSINSDIIVRNSIVTYNLSFYRLQNFTLLQLKPLSKDFRSSIWVLKCAFSFWNRTRAHFVYPINFPNPISCWQKLIFWVQLAGVFLVILQYIAVIETKISYKTNKKFL